MKRRIPESWLSAYLDGELAEDRAALVARFAAKNPAVARQLDELRRVKVAIASLPKVKLAGDNRRRVWNGVHEHSDLKSAREAALSAQMDGELSWTQSAALEASLTGDDLREAGKLAEVRDALRELPKFIAPKDAVARAMDQIRVEAFEGVHAAAHLHELPQVPAPVGLLEQSVSEMKPLAPRYRMLAFRREGWATGLAAALLTGFALFVYTWSPPGIGEGLVAIAPKPPRSAEIATAPAKDADKTNPPVKDVVASRSNAVAPTLDAAPLVDPELLPTKKQPAPPTELPASLVQLVRPGVKFEDPDTKITFVCLDVKKMADRVQLVLLQNSVSDKSYRTTKEGDGAIINVELKATPELLAKVLTDLKDAEESSVERLIAEVQVARPSTEIAKKESRFKQAPPIANIRPNAGTDSSEPSAPINDKETRIIASTTVKDESSAVEPIAADKPRQYVLVFRRYDYLPFREPKKG
jgi:anti-sigma factor RsiW